MRIYVLDASALLAFVAEKPGAGKVDELLRDAVKGRAAIFMSVVNYGEVYGAILREHGPDQARASLTLIHPLPIRLENVTRERALQAVDIKAKYKLYYVDAFAAALAIECKGTLVTSDADFRRLGHSFSLLWLKP